MRNTEKLHLFLNQFGTFGFTCQTVQLEQRNAQDELNACRDHLSRLAAQWRNRQGFMSVKER